MKTLLFCASLLGMGNLFCSEIDPVVSKYFLDDLQKIAREWAIECAQKGIDPSKNDELSQRMVQAYEARLLEVFNADRMKLYSDLMFLKNSIIKPLAAIALLCAAVKIGYLVYAKYKGKKSKYDCLLEIARGDSKTAEDAKSSQTATADSTQYRSCRPAVEPVTIENLFLVLQNEIDKNIEYEHDAGVAHYYALIKSYTDQGLIIDSLVDVYVLFNKALHFQTEEGRAYQLPSDQFQTALMYFFDRDQIFEALLLCGANPFIDNKYGMSLFDFVRYKKLSGAWSSEQIEQRVNLMFDLYQKQVLYKFALVKAIEVQ